MKVFARIDNDGLIINHPETGERLVTFAWPERLHLDNDEGDDEWDAIEDQLPAGVDLTGGASSEVDSVTGEVFMVCEATYYAED